MFGYINVNKDSLEKGHFGMWHTCLCGICMSLKAEYGNRARLTAGWDINFYNLLFHAVTETPAKIEMAKCASSPLKKRSIMQRDYITDRLATANLLLCYFNAIDDKEDGDASIKKRAVLTTLKKSFAKAKKNAPELFEKLEKCYNKLVVAEKENSSNVDKVCDYSAEMSVAVAEYVLQEKISTDSYLRWLCYNVGKWVYIIDALDDLKKDLKTGNYNVLYAWLGKEKTPEDFVKKNEESLEFLFYSTLNKIAESFNDMQLKSYVCVLKNIIYEGMRIKTQEILNKYNRSDKNDA